MTEAEKGVILREVRWGWQEKSGIALRARWPRGRSSAYLIPGMNPFIPRIIFANPPFCIRFIISRICSN